MALAKLKADADVNVRFMAGNSPILHDDKSQGWDRQLGSTNQDPHLGALQPTGQPPTIRFNGSLQDLVVAAATAQPGAVFDLNGNCVQAAMGRPSQPSDISSHSLDDIVTDSPDPSDGTGTPATSNETNDTDMVMFGPSLGVDLMGMPLQDSPHMEPCHSFDSDATPLDSRSYAESPLSVRDGLACSAGVPSLQKIASQASLRPRSPEARCSLESAACMRHSCSFDSKRLDDHLHPFADASAASAVRLGEATVTIRNGTLMLPAGALLLLENSSIVFEDVSICGPAPAPDASSTGKSLPLVFVTEATATLTRCYIGPSDGHGIGVGESATVTMGSCEVSRHRTYGMAVRGSGAVAHAMGCSFKSNGQDGVAVGAGATAELARCVLSHNSMLGLCVSAGAKADVDDCVVEGNGTHGLSAQGGATLSAAGCRISNCEVGVLALDALTTVTVAKCELMQNEHGVHARDGVQVSVTDTRVAHQTIGIVATGAYTKVSLEDCTILRSSRVGMHVFGAAVAVAKRVTVTGSTEHGAMVQHAHSGLDLTECTISGSGASGVQAAVGAAVAMRRCHLTCNKVAGSQVTDTSSSLHLYDCDLSHNGTIGLFANKGSSVSAAECRFDENGSSGCEVRDRGTRADLTSSQLRRNGRVGVYVHSAAALDISTSTISDNHSLALLSGGRNGTDIGGGVVTYSADTVVDGRTKVRHGGRLYKNAVEKEEKEEGAVE